MVSVVLTFSKANTIEYMFHGIIARLLIEFLEKITCTLTSCAYKATLDRSSEGGRSTRIVDPKPVKIITVTNSRDIGAFPSWAYDTYLKKAN